MGLGGKKDLVAFVVEGASAVSVVDCVRLEEACRIPVKAKVEHLGFDHAGRRLLISTVDGDAIVYEGVSGSRLFSVRVNTSKSEEKGRRFTSFSPAGGCIVSGDRLWRGDSGAEWLALPSFPTLIDDEWAVEPVMSSRTETARFRLVPVSPAHEALRLKTRPFTFDEVDLHSIGMHPTAQRARALLAEPIPNEDLLRRLLPTASTTRSSLRRSVRRRSARRKLLAARLNTEAWQVVMRRGAGEAAYAEALRRAESAHALEPNDDVSRTRSASRSFGWACIARPSRLSRLRLPEIGPGVRASGVGSVPMAIARGHLGTGLPPSSSSTRLSRAGRT